MQNAFPGDTDPAVWLYAHARRSPDRPFLETTDGRGLSARVTYGEMARITDRFAAALLSKPVAPGDRVVAQIDKSPEGVALYLACLRIGAVFVPLNTAYTLAELEYFLGDAQPSLAVVRAADLGNVRALATRIGIRHVATLEDLSESSAGLSQPTSLQEPGDPATLAALLYTSGTTGRSKGAMLSRGNLASNAVTLARAWHFTADDVLLHALPIFHVHGLFVAINTVLAAGSSMLFLSKFDADEVLRLMPRATVMMGVPTFYTRLLQHPKLTREVARGMRLFVSGSAPLLAQTHREFEARTGHSILERYGMSETLMNTSNPYQGRRVPGSVGPALLGVEVRIVDPDTGAVIAQPDRVGMIEVRGPNVFSGYWRLPEKTAAELRSDGFFITGDLGRCDDGGYIHIVGRGKDLVITGGYNVYPVEIELEIDALPGVIESAVIGVPHADFGEAVTAIVVADPGSAPDEAAVRAALEKRLAKYKLPKRVVFVAELPRNAMGKVQKSALRERYHLLYGETSA